MFILTLSSEYHNIHEHQAHCHALLYSEGDYSEVIYTGTTPEAYHHTLL